MQATGSAKLRSFVHDAKRFVLDSRADIEHFPLSIYPNALYCSRSGSMKEIHIPRLQNWSELRGGEIWGTQKTILEGHTAGILDIAFSTDGKLLATASIDTTVRLWDLATRKMLQELKHINGVRAIAFSPYGNLLVCALNSYVHYSPLNLWDPATGKELQRQSPMKSTSYVTSIAFSLDGKLLAASSDSEVRLWDPTTGCSLQIFERYSKARSIAFSPDGKILASAWQDGVVILLDPHTGSEIRTFVAHDGCISDIAFSPNGQLLASASFNDNTVNIWDPAMGIKRQTFVGHSKGISSITFSPDGKLLASASLDKTIKLWDPTTGRGQGTLAGHGNSATPIAFSTDGSLLAWVTDAPLYLVVFQVKGQWSYGNYTTTNKNDFSHFMEDY